MEWWQIALIPIGIIILIVLVLAGLFTLIAYMSPRRRRSSTDTTRSPPDSTSATTSIPKWKMFGGLVSLAAIITAFFIFPSQLAQLLPIILIGAGAVMIYKKIARSGMALVGLGLITLWLGTANVAQVGNDLGTIARGVTGGYSDTIITTTGKIELERTFGNPQVFALANTYRRLDVPPGYELCADPIHFVDQGRQSTPAIRYLRSNIEGTVVNIHFYFMRYGESCDLLPSSPDPRARTEEDSNSHLAHA